MIRQLNVHSKRIRQAATVVTLVLMATLLACSVLTPNTSTTPTKIAVHSPVPTATAVKTTPTDTPTDTPSGPCEAVTNSNVTIYQRPDMSAEVFSTVPSGFVTPIAGQTASGWVGFDPGVAQAANIGPFRLRWIQPDKVSLTGDCGSLPVVWAPPPGVCFDMPMEDVAVHADPDSTSPILEVLKIEQFAAVLGVNGSGWVKVDLEPGNSGSNAQGWIEGSTLNMNGPCYDLPTLSE